MAIAGAPIVVIADPIDPSAIARLDGAECRVVDASSGGRVLNAQLPEAWGLVVRSRTQVTAALIDRSPLLKLIARAGVGVDNIDVTAATRRGIRVVNAPTAATTSVAELTVGLMLLLARGLYPRIRATKDGQWDRGTLGTELSGKLVGFVGYGRIAREVALRLAPFGARFVAYDPFLSSVNDGTELVEDLDELLGRADIVSLHAALTPENHHLVNAPRLARMRPGSFLLNVARGPLVDEAALLDALDSGHLAGAALDVFEAEPPTQRRLLEHPRVVATPHLGASTREAQNRAGQQVVDEVLKVLRGQTPQFLVNPEVAKP